MRYTDIIEATITPWTRGDITAVADIAQNRFDTIRGKLSHLGDITASGESYQIWGSIANGQFYAAQDDAVRGYILLDDSRYDSMTKIITMVFILPKSQKRGLASALYRFVLSQGISIMSDKNLTRGSRAIWDTMIDDPKVTVTLIDYDGYATEAPEETPLSNTKMAFSQPQRRMIARAK